MFFLSLNDVLLLASSSSQHTAAPTDPQLFPAPRKHFLLLPAETFKHWQIRPLPRPPPELSPAGRKNSKPRRRQRFTYLKREKSENRSGLKQTCLLHFWVFCRSPPARKRRREEAISNPPRPLVLFAVVRVRHQWRQRVEQTRHHCSGNSRKPSLQFLESLGFIL